MRAPHAAWQLQVQQVQARVPELSAQQSGPTAVEQEAEDERRSVPLHWAGNANVLVGDNAIERHLSGPLRTERGCLKMAAVVVGSNGDA